MYTLNELYALAQEIREAVRANQPTIHHGQLYIHDARKALLTGLWHIRGRSRSRRPLPMKKKKEAHHED